MGPAEPAITYIYPGGVVEMDVFKVGDKVYDSRHLAWLFGTVKKLETKSK